MTCQDDRHIPSGELIRLEASLIERSEFDRVALKLERCEEMATRLKERAEKAEAESVRLNRELGAACELAERSREIILSALNKKPEYWYDSHDNGLWTAEHIAFAIAALFTERDALRADLVDRDACIEALKADCAGLDDRLTRLLRENNRLAQNHVSLQARELTEARRDLLAVAHAIGIVYEPDTGPCWPGPIEEIVKAIKYAKHEAREADSERARADRYLAAMTRRVDARDIGEVSDSDGAIRAIVEEARRG